MDSVVAELASSWERFDVSLRMRRGFDEMAFNQLKTALAQCAESWASSDTIPRLAANILVDIFPATEGNSPLYSGPEAEKITEAAYELQELVTECVAVDEESLG
ncbi:hypothetical protein [Streptomyces sp. CT34]|uniref:hypothetical protein n=1 Tax=Streptomyces sp. CT34 TaxID=1553907 RepID=UPI0005B7878E|nr:hypothetical protein [Streptomyces sp. CT34]